MTIMLFAKAMLWEAASAITHKQGTAKIANHRQGIGIDLFSTSTSFVRKPVLLSLCPPHQPSSSRLPTVKRNRRGKVRETSSGASVCRIADLNDLPVFPQTENNPQPHWAEYRMHPNNPYPISKHSGPSFYQRITCTKRKNGYLCLPNKRERSDNRHFLSNHILS